MAAAWAACRNQTKIPDHAGNLKALCLVRMGALVKFQAAARRCCPSNDQEIFVWFLQAAHAAAIRPTFKTQRLRSEEENGAGIGGCVVAVS